MILHLVRMLDVFSFLAKKRKEKKSVWDYSGDKVVKTLLPVQRAECWSLVRELRSQMSHSGAKSGVGGVES